jgi:hypothetical protein
MTLQIHFDNLKQFCPDNFHGLSKVVGLYFIATKNIDIQYPFAASKLIYIGMSEKPSNSIASRLKGHYEGISENQGLINYRKADDLVFTYINYHSVSHLWQQSVEDLESYFLQDFVRQFGVYPICNNRTGFPEFHINMHIPLKIDWQHFS